MNTSGSIITPDGTYDWDQNSGGYFQQLCKVKHPYPRASPPAPKLKAKMKDSQPDRSKGTFCDFSDSDTIKHLDKILEGDRVYIRSNAPRATETPPKGPIKVQISEHPHDWDESITIYQIIQRQYMIKGFSIFSIDDLMHVNNIATLMAMLITMSGRDVVLNDKDYMPGNEH